MTERYFEYQVQVKREPDKTKLLSDFSEEDWINFSRFVNRRTYQKGDVILAQGAQDRSLYIILNGSVDVIIRALIGKKVIATLSSGSMFGEMAFFDAQPRSADIVAKEETEAFILDPVSFDRFSAWYPRASLKLLKGLARVLSERLRGAMIDI